jgi:gamma-glutamylcyclotransferase (GGCT)/AIG2-like uncharacterized protein YtfP
MVNTVELFVNGTLMRGDVLHRNLDAARSSRRREPGPGAGSTPLETSTPGMIHAEPDVLSVSGEPYELDLEHLERLAASEPLGWASRWSSLPAVSEAGNLLGGA